MFIFASKKNVLFTNYRKLRVLCCNNYTYNEQLAQRNYRVINHLVRSLSTAR